MGRRCWLTCAVVVAVAVSACESDHARTTVDTIRLPPRTFTSGDLSFSYTPAWQAVPPGCVPSLPPGAPYTIVYLSDELLTGSLNPPCGQLPGALKPGAIRVDWWLQQPLVPGGRERLTPPVTSTVIDGHAVTEKSGAADGCTGLHADSSISAVVDAGAVLYGFVACIRGPGVAGNRAAVQNMLASVKIRAPLPSERFQPDESRTRAAP